MKVRMSPRRRIVSLDYGWQCDECGAQVHIADEPLRLGWRVVSSDSVIGAEVHLCPREIDLRR